MTRFDTDSAIAPVRPGVFEGRVDPAWRIARGANGGHIAAILLRAMIAGVDDPQRSPRSLTVHFARVPAEDIVRIEVMIERTGRTMSTVAARMTQDGKLVAIGLAAFSTPRQGPEFSDLAMPEVPSPEQSEPVTDREDFPFGHHFDFRRCLGPAVGEQADRAELGVWMRLREPQTAGHVVVTQLADAFAPAVFAKLGAGGGGAGVPTIDLTIHYREPLPLAGAKPNDWYLGVFRTNTARAGFIEEDGWLWSQDGRLVAQSRQLALLMTE
jgi:acyl-CoA thioesterase